MTLRTRWARVVAFSLAGAIVVTACLSSFGDSQPNNGLKLVAHRGVHQTFEQDGVDDQTCTATRIDPPSHQYMENTLASMGAAFAAGASVVEIDIAATSDGVLAVFHDWDVACRTDGEGEIRSLSWKELSGLDVGYGYTTDGETYPLRGLGVGLMPRLEDVFKTFPDGQFLVNLKSNGPAEALLLQELVESMDAANQVWAVYGADAAVETYVSGAEARGFSEASIRACLAEYVAAAGSSSALGACANTVVVVPSNLAPLLSGWPNDFVDTMARHDTIVVIAGPRGTGIDTKHDLDALPSDLDAYIWTDQVETLSRTPTK